MRDGGSITGYEAITCFHVGLQAGVVEADAVFATSAASAPPLFPPGLLVDYASLRVHPTLYTLTPYTLHPTPYTLHPTL